MNDMQALHIYLVLGLPHSGRRAIIADLIEHAPDTSLPTTLLLHEKEAPPPAAIETKLQALHNTKTIKYTTKNKHIVCAEPLEFEDQAATLFFITNANLDLIEQIEAFKHWLDHNQYQLTRVLTIVDCSLAAEYPELHPWTQATLHFADCVFLNHWEHVPKKWISEFKQELEKQHYPCIIEFIKNGCVKNPALILNSEVRRISHLFDERDAIEDLELDEENLPDEPFELELKEDPYLELDEYGRRLIDLPSVSSILASKRDS